ncbi:MAG TPA: Xaa-Pro dipeptidase [Thermoanaerobaculia bacterium]|nr:Xaa-Pro dipeptidase [Thermoanaerobaculia bacterium]
MDDFLSTIYTAHVTVLKLRHDRALAENGFDSVAIYSGAQHYMFLDDMPYPFKPNPHFKWWAPVVDNPNCWIFYTPGVKPKLAYWQPADYWHKPAETPQDAWTEKFDIAIIANAEDAKQFVPRGKVAFLGEWSDELASWGDLTPNPDGVLNRLHFDRAWKTEYEIECMRRANAKGARGHRAAERAFREGRSGYEIHLAYLEGTGHAEEELPYGNIIALNQDAAILHYYHHAHQRLDDANRHSFLIDAGASVSGYASDITRTYSRNGDEFHELIDAMDAMQQSLVAAVKPDLNYPDLHLQAHRGVAEILARFGFAKDLDAEAIVEKGISSTFFPHGVGHYIGLQVHDVGGFMADPSGRTIAKPDGHPYLRLTRVVEPSHVFTVEPGLYFIDMLLAELRKSDAAKYVNWDKVESFRKFGGIRIEDDIVVTDNGHENLTRDAFANVA